MNERKFSELILRCGNARASTFRTSGRKGFSYEIGRVDTYRYRVQSGSAIVGLNRSFGSHFSTLIDVRYCRQSKCYLQANLQNGFSLLSSYFPIHLISSTTSSYESVSKQIFSPLPLSFQLQSISSQSTALNYHSPSLSSPTSPHTLSTPLSTNENRQ